MGALEEANKYKLTGIAGASATATMLALAAAGGPYAAVTVGFQGKVIFFFLKLFYQMLASIGLVVLNVGVAYVETLSEQKEFDASFDEAFRIINEKGGKLTEAEKKAIDDKIIAAHNKFGTFRVRND